MRWAPASGPAPKVGGHRLGPWWGNGPGSGGDPASPFRAARLDRRPLFDGWGGACHAGPFLLSCGKSPAISPWPAWWKLEDGFFAAECRVLRPRFRCWWGSRRPAGGVLAGDRLVCCASSRPTAPGLFRRYRLGFSAFVLLIWVAKSGTPAKTERPPEPSIPRVGNEPSGGIQLASRRSGPVGPKPARVATWLSRDTIAKSSFSPRRRGLLSINGVRSEGSESDLRVLVGEEELVLEVEDPSGS